MAKILILHNNDVIIIIITMAIVLCGNNDVIRILMYRHFTMFSVISRSDHCVVP